MAHLSDLVGFALTVKSTRLYEKESGVEGSFSTVLAPSRFSPRNLNRLASKSNTKINWKVDASSRGIQLKIH